MATTDKGAIAAASLFCGDAAINAFNVTNSRIGVGDSSTAFAASQTDLQAATNKLRKIVDSAPVRTTNSVDYTTTYGLAEANFEWLEIALFNSSSGDHMATRRTLSGFGTKTSSEQWTVTLTVVFTPL
jgi:hypothetical protein